MTDRPQFGVRVDGVEAIARPSAYCVVRRDGGLIALVRTPKGYFLPGGGQHSDETVEDAAIRETTEETGYVTEIVRLIGVADQFASKSDGRSVRKESSFFLAEVVGEGTKVEQDHEVVWLGADEAIASLKHASHAWAVERFKEGASNTPV